MHSTSIFLLGVALLVTVAVARPGRRPWPGNHRENTGNAISQGHDGSKWSTYRLPSHIRLPKLLGGKLGQPLSTFTAKKILNGKYLLVSPALIFKLKEVANDTETSTTVVPEVSTTVPPDVVETTTVGIGEEIVTTDLEVEETTTPVPLFFRKRSFSINDNEQLLFLDD